MMQTSWFLVRLIGEAVLNCAKDQLPKRHLHNQLLEIAFYIWDGWGRNQDEKGRVQELEGIARPQGRVRPYIEIIVQDIAGVESEETRRLLLTYLSVVPSTIRMALRRPRDPKGLTVPNWLVPRHPEDMLNFLPAQVPMFEPGMRPLPDVDWELTDLLGVGGFGEVWKAHNPTFQSVPPVCLKFCNDPRGINKFRHEAAILTQAMPEKPHPGLVELRATYIHHDPPCLEFEYISGGDLLQWFKGRKRERGPLSARKATSIIYRLARLVGYFHRRKPPIVHRDLKPANILIRMSRRGKMELKICDFGIGGLASSKSGTEMDEVTSRRLIKRSAMRGWHSPMYASPQQVKGGAPDPRDDVHALGIIWYQLLMNDLTLTAPTDLDWIDDLAHRHGLPREQIEFLANCIHVRADLRPADGAALAQEIKTRFQDVLSGKPAPGGKAAGNSKSEAKGLGRFKFWS